MSLSEELRENVSMWDVLDMLEIEYEIGSDGQAFIYARDRAENTPSLHVSDSSWYDFGSGEGGGIFEFLMRYGTDEGMTFKHALKVLQRMDVGGLTRSPAPKMEKPLIDFTGEVEQLPFLMSHDCSQWLEDRIMEKWGLPVSALEAWNVRVGPADSLVIPHPGFDQINMVHVRDLTLGAKRPKFSYKGSRAVRLYQQGQMARNGVFLLAEGESDAWTLKLMTGMKTLALPSGATHIDRRWFPQDTPFLAFPDRGEAGEKMAMKLQALFPEHCSVASLPDGCDDVNEAYRAGWNLKVEFVFRLRWWWES